MRIDASSLIMDFIMVFVLCFLFAPIIIVCVSSFCASTYITFPPQGFSFNHYITLFTDPRWVSSLINSLIIAVCTTIVSVFISIPAALVLSGRKIKGANIVYFLILLPMFFPGAIIGINLLMTLSKIGLQGTYIGFVIGHALETVPISFMILVAAMTRLDPTITEAAMSLGANRIRTFFEINLPLLKPAILSSAIISFILSLHEFSISYFIMSYRIVTLPIVIWTSLKYTISPVVGAASVVLILMMVICLFAISKLIGIERIGF
jgi:putative spermidine/putrescine transport system permease protein